MTTTLKKYIHLFLGLTAFGFIIFFLFSNARVLNLVLKVKPQTVIAIALLHFLAQIFQTSIGWILLSSTGARILFRQYFWVNAFAMLCNYMPFQGSMFVRGGLLRQNYKVRIELYITVVTLTFLLGQSVYSFFGSLTLLLSRLNTALAVLLLTISILTLLPLVPFFRNSLLKFFQNRWRNISHFSPINSTVMPRVILVISLGFLLLAFRYYLLFRSLDYHIGYNTCAILACASGLSTLLRLTPAGLGIREGLTGLIAYGINFDITVAVLIVLLDRIISLMVVIPLGLISWPKLKSDVKGIVI